MKTLLVLFLALFIGSGVISPNNNTVQPPDVKPQKTKPSEAGINPTPETPVPITLIPIITPGEIIKFLMGSTDQELKNQPTMKHKEYFTHDEQPAHEITLTQPYAMSKFEITNHQYCGIMNRALAKGGAAIKDGDLKGRHGKKFLGITHLFGIKNVDGRLVPAQGYRDHPVHAVTWYGATAFCNFLSMQEGLEPVYNLETWTWDTGKNGYRLPTEAEWEYAARKNQRLAYAWGDSIRIAYLNYWASYEKRNNGKITVPVGFYDGTKKEGLATENNSSPFGLYDMTGNVWEWCWDWYGESYYKTSPATDPKGPKRGDQRLPFNEKVPTKVWRGCGWGGNNAFSRIAKRYSVAPETAINEVGFRIARNLEK